MRTHLRRATGGAALVLSMILGCLPGPAAAVPPEAEKLLREAQGSRGGEEALARIVEVRRRGELVLATSEGERRLAIEITVRPPDRLILKTGSDEHLVRRVLEAGAAYQVIGSGDPTPLAEEEAGRLRRLIRVDEAFLVRYALSGDLEVRGVEDAGPGQVAADLPAASGRAVTVATADGSAYRLVLPAGGGLPVRVDYGSGDDDARRVSDVFMDWQVVNGILFPMEIVMFQEGVARSYMRYSSIEVDLSPKP